MKLLLGCNVKMSLIVGGGKNLWWRDKKLVGWGESNKGIFFGEEMIKVLASKGGKGGRGEQGGSPSPSPPAGKTLFILDILARRQKRTNA